MQQRCVPLRSFGHSPSVIGRDCLRSASARFCPRQLSRTVNFAPLMSRKGADKDHAARNRKLKFSEKEQEVLVEECVDLNEELE
ncbi:hypothetical protein NDU88_002287 [Pleurodeles waltl]|uniref:Uncharacterized protein n=1 Tax=Pleurodeles waltl TaxID=8319 RepID=A0AAV7UWT7_PLEWA|nr:hypothetical protein NDU88_002287 [Pleurodeles waltl]